MREIIAGLRGYVQRAGGPPDAAAEQASAVPSYPLDAREAERLRFLSDAGLANADRDAVFDGITRYMAGVAGFPICLITMIDSHVQWVKSAHGGEPQWSPRAEAFCNYTICGDALMAIPNAGADPRFASNPLVACTPGVRAYFGYPITAPSGVRLGSLCLVDLKPRKLPQLVEENLRSMAEIVSLVIGQRWRAHTA
jgi:GAF domain-containing protein